jgi:glycosyltransferase involved in cell wall biosynthesis
MTRADVPADVSADVHAASIFYPPAGLSTDPCFEPVVRLPLPGNRKRIRVVELLATGTSGGAQEHVFSLVTRIDRQRYDVSVLSLSNGPAVRRLERSGVPVCVLDDMDDAAAIDAVAAHLAAVKADVVHNHMYRAEVVGTQAAWSLAGPPTSARGRARRRPFIVGTVHSSRVRSDADRELVRRLTPRMDHLIAVSRAIVRKIEDEGRDGAPVSLIYNGVDLTRYAEPDICGTLHEEFPIPLGAPIVGVVARLEQEKGHPTLIEAWPAVLAAVPSAHLLVVGEGSTREALEAQVAALGIGSSVTFTGRRDDVPAVTAALDVAVLPSYREAQGLSILEAMALYRPVVASAVGGIPEMIEHGRTGLLVPPRDPATLAAAIVRLLADHPYADTLARAGRDLVYDRFCVELMVRAIESIYDEAVADERRLAAG